MEVDKVCLDFIRLDMFGVKIKVNNLRRSFKPLTISDGYRDYTFVTLLVMYNRDLE